MNVNKTKYSYCLFPSLDVYSAKKGFGKFKACVNADQSLTLQCFYPACDNMPPFNCHISEVKGDVKTLLGTSNKAKVKNKVLHLNTSAYCQLNIEKHKEHDINESKNYTCSLSRKTTTDEKNITVRYSGKTSFVL